MGRSNNFQIIIIPKMMRTVTLFRSKSLFIILIAIIIQTEVLGQTVDERTPIAEFGKGFTVEQIAEYRANYTLPNLLKGGDITAWLCL